MGLYLNPDMGKEVFLKKYGIVDPRPTKDNLKVPGEVLVCWVDNGWMTAAAIVLDENKMAAFSHIGDRRPKVWFMVELDDVVRALEESKDSYTIKEVLKAEEGKDKSNGGDWDE